MLLIREWFGDDEEIKRFSQAGLYEIFPVTVNKEIP